MRVSEAREVLGYLFLLRGEHEQSETQLPPALEFNANRFGTLQALGSTLTFLGDAKGGR